MRTGCLESWVGNMVLVPGDKKTADDGVGEKLQIGAGDKTLDYDCGAAPLLRNEGD